MLGDFAHHGGEVDAVGGWLPFRLHQAAVNFVQTLHPGFSAGGIGGGAFCQQGLHDRARLARQGQIGTPDAAELDGVGPDVDQGELRFGGARKSKIL